MSDTNETPRTYECPTYEILDPWQNPRMRAWRAVVDHPIFEDRRQTEGSILEAVLAKQDTVHEHTKAAPVIDQDRAKEYIEQTASMLADAFEAGRAEGSSEVLASHECPTAPVWRPTTADEIQPGWEVRSRHRSGTEATWGIALHRDDDGDWCTETGRMLTWDTANWTYETTAPLPEPEPWPDELIDGVKGAWYGACTGSDFDDEPLAVLDFLAARYPGFRAAALNTMKG